MARHHLDLEMREWLARERMGVEVLTGQLWEEDPRSHILVLAEDEIVFCYVLPQNLLLPV